jgi:hypothetical protein
MRWFRSNGGGVAWLAIFALACQFVLTFGHVHTGSVSAVSAALALSADPSDGSASAPSSPAHKPPTGPCPGLLRGLQSYRFGKRTGFADLTRGYPADFIHSGLALAVSGDRVRLT